MKKTTKLPHKYVVFILKCRCGQEMELRVWTDKDWQVQCRRCGKIHKGMGKNESK
jgi:hypothetical protein